MIANIFIVVYIVFIVVWDAPQGSFVKRIADRVFKVARWLGLSHTWAMYAPDPPFNTVVAEIHADYGQDNIVDVTPPFFDRHDQLGRASGLRAVTLQRHLLFDYSDPVRKALCKQIINSLLSETHETDAAGQFATLPRRDPNQIRIVAVTLPTRSVFSDSESSGQISREVVFTFDVVSLDHRSLDHPDSARRERNVE